VSRAAGVWRLPADAMRENYGRNAKMSMRTVLQLRQETQSINPDK